MDVTVIVPTRNSERFLGEALGSIRRQSTVQLELIVVDAGSTDSTREVARRFGATIVEQNKRGLSDAWNVGIQAAQSRYIAFLDSDDLWIEDTLLPRLEKLRREPEAAVCFGAVRHVLEAGLVMPTGFRQQLFENNIVAPIPGTMAIDRKAFDLIGGFDTNLTIAGDADWVTRAKNRGLIFCKFNKCVLLKRIHDKNLTLDAAKVNSELLQVLRRSIREKRSLNERPLS